jgi:chemosensory pili system protein ChpB (putative protein-glutamate methylesterase)
VDSAVKQQYLSSLAVQAGHHIGYVYLLAADSPLPNLSQEVDAWVMDIVDVEEQDPHKQNIIALLDELLEQTHLPVILSDAAELQPATREYGDWVRRMLQRLERLRGDVNLKVSVGADEVWVLAASTGGPAAVKDFIGALPPALNVAFVYVQHIDAGQSEALSKMMANAGHYPVSIAAQGLLLAPNTITLVPADRSLTIHDNGTLVLSKKPWTGFYAPSIDQVAANVARIYRQRSGMIIFSGMGDDGAASCRFIKQYGGKVWVQSPEQSTIASMPDAALATGAVSFVGSPVDLAQKLAVHQKYQPKNNTKSTK